MSNDLILLKKAAKMAGDKMDLVIASDPIIKQAIQLVEKFIKDKQLICYGGTAINNILPKKDQFYDMDNQIADYDFFSVNAVSDAKQLADIMYKNNLPNVEAKAGVHVGTFKVYVNYVGVADITYIPKLLFNSLKKESIKISGIYYTPPDFLRMSMYLELSRPAGDTSRWEKVYERLQLLNKHHPLVIKNPKSCKELVTTSFFDKHILQRTFKKLSDLNVLFMGNVAIDYFITMLKLPKSFNKSRANNIPFTVIANNVDIVVNSICDLLTFYSKVTTKEYDTVGEIIPKSVCIFIDDKPLVLIYHSNACYSYNNVNYMHENIKMASIETLLSFNLALKYLIIDTTAITNSKQIMCESKLLSNIINKIKHTKSYQKFSITCYGKQEGLTDMRMTKQEKFNTLKKNSKEYEFWFFKYIPSDNVKVAKKTLKKNYKKNIKKTIKKTLKKVIKNKK